MFSLPSLFIDGHSAECAAGAMIPGKSPSLCAPLHIFQGVQQYEKTHYLAFLLYDILTDNATIFII
jgi:hypothetical protein